MDSALKVRNLNKLIYKLIKSNEILFSTKVEKHESMLSCPQAFSHSSDMILHQFLTNTETR